MINKALDLAFKAHKGQKDKSGEPYILHPVRVALSMDSEITKVVALLHDVVEDSEIDIESIEEQFGSEIALPVSLLTHREGVEYKDYLKALSVNPIAKAVKLGDLKDNLDPERTFEGRDTTKYEAAQKYLLNI